jgi:polyhydroxyalkanoate synthesis regulator phasin
MSFRELGLDDEQIRRIVELSGRIASMERATNRPAGEEVDWDGIRRRIKAAVERGDMTREEAEEHMTKLRREHAAEREQSREVNWDRILRRVKAAVERGDMTREEAEEHITRLRKEQAARRETREVDWDGVKKRVEGAVERGEITREEADRIYKGMKRRGHEVRGDESVSRRIAKALIELGIDRENVRDVMGVIKRGIHVMKTIEDEDERNEALGRLRTHLTEELGLTDEQIEGVAAIGRRLLSADR